MPTTVSGGWPEVVQAQPELRSDVSSIAVSPILPLIPRHARPRTAVVAGTAVAGTLLFVLVVLLAFRRDPAPAPAALPSAVPLPASVVPVLASAPAPDLPTATATPTPTPTPTAIPIPTSTHRRVYAPRPAAAALDCDPPFTIDDVGHKHYKPACLK
jgi:hypothetical protein